MRHFLRHPSSLPGLAGRMAKATGPRVLIALPGRPQRRGPRRVRARARAVPVAAVAVPAEKEQAAALAPAADDEAKRVQAPPPSGGWAGHARGDVRSREAPSRAPTW
jgi:hypothetical protein